MNRPRLTAQDLRHRYRQGERNFAGVDLSGESLRGMNLRDINLSGADLNHTDIRSTNFTNAVLKGASFNLAKAGLTTPQIWGHSTVTLILAIVSSFLVRQILVAYTSYFFLSGTVQKITSVPGFLVLLMLVAIFGSIAFQGFSYKALSANIAVALITSLGAFVSAFVAGVPLQMAFLAGFTLVSSGVIASAGGIVLICTSAIILASIAIIAGALTGVFVVAIVCVLTIILSISIGISAEYQYIYIHFENLVIFVGIGVSAYAASSALRGNEKFALIRVCATMLGAVFGGTSFNGTDLTGIYFTNANLKNANFTHSRQKSTNLTHVRWHNVKNLDRAWVGASILQSPRVRDLLVTPENGANQDLSNLNLRGANLAGSTLIRANFTGAVLSEAVLTEANLQEAIFTEANCIGTDFSRADFTGATLEAWNIESNTKLDDIHCDYVYLLRNQQERRPISGVFGPSEFTKLFQEVLDTVDLIFRNGVDWKAFIQTLNKIQVEHAGANIAIQAIENKGDGLMVVKLNTAPVVDKEAIHRSFMQRYQKALKAVEEKYKTLLNSKDQEIQKKDRKIDDYQEEIIALIIRKK